QEVLEHIRDAEQHYVALFKDTPVGFGFIKINKTNLYLSGDAVCLEHQGKGLHTLLTIARIVYGRMIGCDSVSVRTQNPRVEYSVRKAFRTLGIPFELERIFKKAHYGRRLSTYPYVCPEREINDIYSGLDVERGDAFELLFRLPAVQITKEYRRICCI
ncbi:MAG: hypothetical protein QXS93_01265, partial [Candidatus Micrarchaeia archaeon]